MSETKLKPEDSAGDDSLESLNAETFTSSSFVLAVDSDGCAFDSMDLKHDECFTPTTIKHWGLQPVAREARETATFINLRSRSRGLNRFEALVMLFDMLADRPEVSRRTELPRIDGLRRWTATSQRLSRESLVAATQTDDCPSLRTALAWTDAVNEAVRVTANNPTPVPGAGECLRMASNHASVVIVSAADTETLRREWGKHGLLDHVTAIAGQEAGTKADTLKRLKDFGLKADNILMVGDAPGDLTAAKATNTPFFPIIPSKESASWAHLAEEGLPRFFAGSFCGAFAENLAEQFLSALPEKPSWPSLSAEKN